MIKEKTYYESTIQLELLEVGPWGLDRILIGGGEAGGAF